MAAGSDERRPAVRRLDERALELAQAAARRLGGESPQRAAWRRLRCDRAAWWCLVLLTTLGVLALLAPLLPLPSPLAGSPRAGPQAPVWPWVAPLEQDWRARYWSLPPLDAWLLRLRWQFFGTLQTGPWLGTDSGGRDLFYGYIALYRRLFPNA